MGLQARGRAREGSSDSDERGPADAAGEAAPLKQAARADGGSPVVLAAEFADVMGGPPPGLPPNRARGPEFELFIDT